MNLVLIFRLAVSNILDTKSHFLFGVSCNQAGRYCLLLLFIAWLIYTVIFLLLFIVITGVVVFWIITKGFYIAEIISNLLYVVMMILCIRLIFDFTEFHLFGHLLSSEFNCMDAGTFLPREMKIRLNNWTMRKTYGTGW